MSFWGNSIPFLCNKSIKGVNPYINNVLKILLQEISSMISVNVASYKFPKQSIVFSITCEQQGYTSIWALISSMLSRVDKQCI